MSSVLNICQLCLRISPRRKNSHRVRETASHLLPDIALPFEEFLVCSTCIAVLDLLQQFRENCIRSQSVLSEMCDPILCKLEPESDKELLNRIRDAKQLLEDSFKENEMLIFGDRDEETTEMEVEYFEVDIKEEDFDNKDKIESPASHPQSRKRNKRADEEVKCDLCSETMPYRELRSHMKANHRTKKEFSCLAEDCEAQFLNQITLRKHVKRFHPDIELPAPDRSNFGSNQAKIVKSITAQCRICNAEVQRFSMFGHLRSHAQNGGYICDGEDCNYEFPSATELAFHRINEHSSTGKVKRFTCEVCGLACASASRLNYHLNSHTNHRPFVCDYPECGKAFTSPSQLRVHKFIIHVGVKNFVCEICTKAFKTKAELEIHVKSHGEPSLPCKICGRLLMNRKTMTMHLRTHTNDKRYQCHFENCGKTFVKGSGLQVHLRSHTGEKPYKCTQCEASFAYNASLKKHTAKSHNESVYSSPDSSSLLISKGIQHSEAINALNESV